MAENHRDERTGQPERHRSLLRDLQGDIKRHGGLRTLETWVAASYHYGRWSRELRSPLARWVTSKAYGVMALGVQVATGCTVHREATIGRELHIVHVGNIRIHPEAVLGERVGIMQDVTIGTNMEREGVPTIGNDVFIGAGARILGKVTIGDGARIAANSLVISDVPSGATAIGVPARVLRYTGRKAEGGTSHNQQ